jgi:hypothetical protein
MSDEPKVDTAAPAAADELADLKRRVAELEAAAAPAKPFVAQPMEQYDWAARATMPPSVIAEMARAVGTSLLRDVVREGSRPVTLPLAGAEPATGGSGWSPDRPLEPPPGIGLIDAQLDVQDAVDKVALTKRLAGG